MNERTIFLQALEIPDPAQRNAFLNQACAGDTALRQNVAALLQSHEDASGFLEKPAVEQMATGDFVAATPLEPNTPTDVIDSGRAKHAGPGNAEVTQAEGVNASDADLCFLSPPTKRGFMGRLGHYDVQEVIGKGGFGIVLKAFDQKLHRIVAIKVLSPAYAANGAARKRFIREAQSAAAVKNEHVVAIYSVQDEAQPPYLVMEYIDGISLQDKLDKRGPLSLKEVLRIGSQTAEGLTAAHKQGLVHRDIKPVNILLENGVERVKITDFGLARAVDDASVTQSGIVAGTPMYMSPEQAEGLPIDHRSDLFSLGTVLYAMCTGHPPFRATGVHAVLKRVIDATPRPMREINNEIPEWLCAVVVKLHAKKPEERFQSAKEVAELLSRHLADVQAGRAGNVSDGSVAPPAPVADAPGSPRRRRVVVLAAALLAALVALPVVYGIGLLFFWKNSSSTDPVVNPPPVVPVVSNKDGFVQLFNGKDLSGWKTHPNWPGSWTVEDGVLVGPDRRSYLFTERQDYENMHIRVHAKINSNGNSGVFFRVVYGNHGSTSPFGYEAEIAPRSGGTGSLYIAIPGAKTMQSHKAKTVVPADQWFVQEVIAADNHIVIKIDGQTTVDYDDPSHTFRKGGLALQVDGPGTVVHFKSVEIKELPHSAPKAAPGYRIFEGHDSNAWQTAFSRDGAQALSSHEDGQILLWDVAKGTVLKRMAGKHDRAAECVAFGPDETWAISGGQDRVVRVWDLKTGAQKGVIQGFTGAVSRVVLFRDGKRALAGSSKMRLLNLETLTIEKVYEHGNTNFDAIGVALSSDEKRALSVGDSTIISLWDVETAMRIRTFEPGPKGSVRSIAFSNDGNRAVTAGPDNACRVWNVDTGKVVFTFKNHTAQTLMAQFMPDDRYVASKSRDKTVRVWDSLTGMEIAKLDVPAIVGSPIAISPDGRQILLGCWGPTLIGLWQLPEMPALPRLLAPFNADKAKEDQDAWAKQRGTAVEITNSIGMKLRLIPPGTFDLSKSYRVIISKPFLMGTCEVTVGQFKAFVRASSYLTTAEATGEGGLLRVDGTDERKPEYTWTHEKVAQSDQHPVAMMSWNDAVAFCKWLSAMEGKTYRLPTEAEWEWAGRAGSAAQYHFGSDAQVLGDYAWYQANAQGSSQPVGQKKPNAWGLYDIHGNVAEYCLDWYTKEPPTGLVIDPHGPGEGTARVARSMSFRSTAGTVRFGTRAWHSPTLSSHHLGFRVVCEDAK